MIKKMMALLAAISCAIGAWADVSGHISGTDFSPRKPGSFDTSLDDNGEDTGTNYWFTGDTSFVGTIVTNALEEKFLDFESDITNPLYRTINNCNGLSPSQFTAMPIGGGLFIDTHVQFTPYLVNENHPAPSAVTDDDKLIVWVREIEVENDANLTNLIVTAGYYNNFDEVSESNYVVTNLSPAEIATLCSTTNRLTIKSFSSITGKDDAPAGFVVYINKKSLEYAADAFSGGSYVDNLDTTPAAYYEPGRHRLFPSLMAGDQTNHDKLSGVGYAGMGKIGEVWFDDYSTDYPDFAGDDHNITIVKGEGVVSYVYNNITYNEDYSTAVSVPTVTISNVVYNTSAGYQHKTGTWYIGSQVVNNTSTADGDIGTFDLANGNRLVLAGFKANYLVGGTEYQSLFGIEPTETTGAYNAAKNGGTIKLNKDILIDEGTHKQIVVGEDDDLTIDLNGHTLRGTSAEVDEPSIVNNLGTLTIIDTSVGQTGKVLGCLSYDSENDEWINNYKAIKSTGEYVVSNALTAGTYELIITDVNADKFVISAGSYICPHDDEEHPEIHPAAFYLASYLAPGATVTSWTQDPVTEFWYAIVGGSAPTTYAVTFSTNSVPVAEYTTNITAGATLPDGAIPAFTGGAWDVDPTNAVINAATNFNYTIETSYTLTYVSDHGTVPDGVVYTASTPDFALAAAPTAEGWTFAGWVIGSVTNEASATFVVADHLEDTTATAAWAPVIPTGTAIYLTMGSGVDSLSTSSNGTDWVAYTEALQDVELGSTLYIKGTSSVTGYDVPQFSIVVDNTHATEQTALVVNKSAIVYFPQTAIEQEWADRDGTAAKPFVIRNYADLVALKNGVANGTITNQCFEQVANIDMDGEDPWEGIGTFECREAGNGAFEGTYDGGNHVISNVTFDRHEYNGIFASVVGGVVKNLTVDVDGFAATTAFGGAAITGVAFDSYLTNLVATGTIIGQSSTPCTHSAAGIAVRMEGTVAYACTNRCEIWSSKNKVGGIAAIGQGPRPDYLTLCSNEGDIHASKTGSLGEGGVGGLFGYQGYTTINYVTYYEEVTYTDCRNIGYVTSAASDNSGSILGAHSNGGPTFVGTIITTNGMVVSGSHQDGVTYGKSIGNGLVELCTQAAFETNNTYSTLYSGLTPTFEFSAPGTISFNTNLFQATAFAITATGGMDVVPTESAGIVTFTAGSSDPWAPTAETDEAAAAKIADLFPGTEVAANVTTYAMYTNLVDYIKGVTSQTEVPTDLTEAQETWMWKSYILGADPLFVTNAVVAITSLDVGENAGEWDFIVKVTEGELTTAHSVAAAKVAALVQVTDSLSPASWSAPDPEDVHADLAPLLGTNLIKVTVDFGTDTSGFMKVSE